jgi:hypothetical protein
MSPPWFSLWYHKRTFKARKPGGDGARGEKAGLRGTWTERSKELNKRTLLLSAIKFSLGGLSKMLDRRG